MRHTLRLHGVTVGYSELEHAEPKLGRARGAFRPGLGYDLIQPVFRLYAAAVPRSGSPQDEAMLRRYHKSRDALALELQDADGRVVRTSAVHIADYTVEEGAQALEIEVLIKDDEYWERRAAGGDRSGSS